MQFPADYTPVKGKYTVAERDAFFDRVAEYPDAADGSTGQVPTKTAQGIAWETPSGGVASFNGRTGAVVPATGDYTAAMVGAAEPGAELTVSLTAAGWSSGAQTVSNAAFLASGYSYIVAPESGSYAAYASSQVYADDVTVDGSMTFHYAGNAPSVALTVNILRQEATE